MANYPYPVLAKLLDTLYSAQNFVVCLIDGEQSSFSVSSTNINVTNDTFSVSHNFVDSTRVRVSPSTASTLPTSIPQLNINTVYYVVQSAAGVFKLSLTKGGTPINITATGSGTVIVTEEPLGQDDSEVANWIRHELADYKGTGRQAYTPGVSYFDETILKAATTPKMVTFMPTSGDLLVRYILVIRNGGTAAKSTVGTIEEYEDFGSVYTFTKNTPKVYSLQQTLA